MSVLGVVNLVRAQSVAQLLRDAETLNKAEDCAANHLFDAAFLESAEIDKRIAVHKELQRLRIAAEDALTQMGVR